MSHNKEFPFLYLGQEALSPDGLGRVVAFNGIFPDQWIQVRHYHDNSSAKYDPKNIRLVKVGEFLS